MRATSKTVEVCSAIAGWICALGCAGSGAGPDATLVGPSDGAVDVPGQLPGNPQVGGHALAYYALGDSRQSITTSTTTQRAGSTIIVSVGRGINAAHMLPTDSMANA